MESPIIENRAEDLPKQLKGEALHDDALKRFREVCEAESYNREMALEDDRMLSGDGHWPQGVREERKSAGRPCLTFNELPTYVDNVLGEQLKARPAIKVSAADPSVDGKKVQNLNGTTDYSLAQVMESHVRSIERRSRAHLAYDTGFQHAVEHGFGYWRVMNVYPDETTFEQELVVRQIWNSYSVYMDQKAMMLGPEFTEFCYVTSLMSQDDFDDKHPNARHDNWDQGIGDEIADWFEDGAIRIAEYMCAVKERRTYYRMSDGAVYEASQVEPLLDELEEAGITVVEHRESDAVQWLWYKMSPFEVLEGPVRLPGRYCPVIPCFGKMQAVDGQPRVRGLIRHAHDPQRAYNMWRTAGTETVMLQPRAPWVATAKQIWGKYRDLWKNANHSNISALPYEPDPLANGPPQRQIPPQTASGMVTEASLAKEDIRGTIGMYSASLGQRDNSESGRAIALLQKQGDTGSYAFVENLSRAIEYTGMVLIDMIPKVYTGERTLRLWNSNDVEDYVRVNQPMIDDETGEEIILNDLSTMKMDVSVQITNNHSTQRMMAAESMMQLFQTNPSVSTIGMDILARNLDFPGADEFAERMQKMLPPEVRGGGEGDEEGPQPVPPEQVEQMIAAAQQEAAQQALAQAQESVDAQEIEIKMMEAQTNAREAKTKQYEAETKRMAALDGKGKGKNVDTKAMEDVAEQVLAEFMQGLSQLNDGPALPVEEVT